MLLSAEIVVKREKLHCTPSLRIWCEEDSGYKLFTVKLGNQLSILGSVEDISFQVDTG